jgi:hypothetical protein
MPNRCKPLSFALFCVIRRQKRRSPRTSKQNKSIGACSAESRRLELALWMVASIRVSRCFYAWLQGKPASLNSSVLLGFARVALQATVRQKCPPPPKKKKNVSKG